MAEPQLSVRSAKARELAHRLARHDHPRTLALRGHTPEHKRPGHHRGRLARRTQDGPRGYPVRTRQRTLTTPTDDGEVVAQVAKSLLADALLEPVRLLGVGVSGIVDGEGAEAQLSLFDVAADPAQPEAPPRKRRLNRALDALADRFGDDVVRRASQADARHATLSGQWKKGSRDTHGPIDREEGNGDG